MYTCYSTSTTGLDILKIVCSTSGLVLFMSAGENNVGFLLCVKMKILG